ncbi:putative GST-like protein YibF [Roseovarius litorisediminis]|uniref:Putative GST-like protein YibF n=1 Tax=Roseovarius litorisediminis TaxID=1312363 RepID=A0A1Y5TK67_9RHOB|nr:glutathione S-transferase family protein [Roseovarius litorisediminis]SLN65994.1 putative GST-like protein YibF [Roseovarius litorisediminis]
MKLVTATPSPFGRKVKVVLYETGLIDEVEIELITTTPFDTDTDLASANPMGKIPALIREQGPALYDSRVITRYLDAHAGTELYPEARIWDTLTLEATADGILEAALSMVYEHRLRPPEKVFDGWVEAQWAKAERAVTAVNARWMSHLSGPLDMGQIAIACALGYLDFRHADRNWRKGNDALDDWFAVFAQRDSMKATAPE